MVAGDKPPEKHTLLPWPQPPSPATPPLRDICAGYFTDPPIMTRVKIAAGSDFCLKDMAMNGAVALVPSRRL